MKRPTGEENEIRGVGMFHSRVYPEDEEALGNLYHRKGLPMPWIDPTGPDEFSQPEFLAFLHALVHMGMTRREIFFARILNTSWAEIGDVILIGATAQAAQNEYAKTIRDFPALARAMPKNQTEEDET